MRDIIEHAMEIRRERARRARAMFFRDKFLAGGRLFDEASAVTMAGIRHTHPELNEPQVLDELRRRLLRRERRENKHMKVGANEGK